MAKESFKCENGRVTITPILAPTLTLVPTPILEGGEHELLPLFITFLNNILTVLRLFMTERQVEIAATNLWQNFIKNYTPKSSKGYLMVGRRINELDGTLFFCERTFGKPAERIKEWKNRLQKYSYECADTIFGETFAQALLNQIRVHRCTTCDNGKVKKEVEWFKMENLSWENIDHVLKEVCTFTALIKSTKVIVKIDINSASLDMIKTLPLIGPKIAARIVEKRTTKYNNFTDLENRVDKLGSRIINAFKEFAFFSLEENANNVVENRLVNINTATSAILEKLPGIGSTKAQNIVAHRKTKPFSRISELENVSAIGEKTYSKVKDLITV